MAQIKTTYDGGQGSGGRSLDALVDPKKSFRQFEDFAASDAASIFTLVQLSGSTTTPAVSVAGGYAGGTMRYTTDTGINDGCIMHFATLAERPDVYNCSAEIRIAFNDIADTNFFFGFSEGIGASDIISTNAIAVAAAGDDRIGWFADTNTTTGKFQVFCSKNAVGLAGTTTGELDTEFGVDSSETAGSNDVMYRFGISVQAGIVRFYLNGELKHTVRDASIVSDASLYPVLLVTTDVAAANTVDVDYVDWSGDKS